jgi:hypothetical protein
MEDVAMTRQPPVPPEQRPKRQGNNSNVKLEDERPDRENFDQQGRHGNIRQNTRNQGYQQDR